VLCGDSTALRSSCRACNAGQTDNSGVQEAIPSAVRGLSPAVSADANHEISEISRKSGTRSVFIKLGEE